MAALENLKQKAAIHKIDYTWKIKDWDNQKTATDELVAS